MMLNELKNAISHLGKPQWQPLLTFLAELHADSIHPPFFQLPYLWEEIAPSRELGVLFGNWDTVHIALDTVLLEPKHAIQQIMNSLALQQEDGLLPGHVSLINNQIRCSHYSSYPPLWPCVVQEYIEQTGHIEQLPFFLEALQKQIQWFEKHRRIDQGFYYIDRLDHLCESGVDDGVRFDLGTDTDNETICIDTTSHVYSMYIHAAKWAVLCQKESACWQSEADRLAAFIQQDLFDEETGFFHDLWSVGKPHMRILAFEGIWPIVTQAATYAQAQRVINENLLEPSRFFSTHPIPSISLDDPHFDYCHWRGPTRNSMTYWAARGCWYYDRKDAACLLLEKALDTTAKHFTQTGKLWEFYHPQGGDPRALSRSKEALASIPLANYLGHNPLIAMAQLWERCKPNVSTITSSPIR